MWLRDALLDTVIYDLRHWERIIMLHDSLMAAHVFENLRPDDVFLDLRHGIFHNLLHTKRDWHIDCSTCRFEMRRWDVSWSLSTRSSTTCGTENVPLCSALPNRMTTICSTKRAPRSSHPPTVFPTYHLERTRFARGVKCKTRMVQGGKGGKAHMVKGQKSGSNKVVRCCWTQERRR